MRKAKQAFEENKVEKHDSAKVLRIQRTEARLEIGRILIWAQHQGTHVKVKDLEVKLSYLHDKILREDMT